MLKYPCVSLSLRGQQANINRQQAIDIAENRTFSYQQIHPKKHRYWMVNNYQLRTMNYKLSTSVICLLSSVVCPLSSALYICREPSTNQLFYAKQTQFPKSQMNVSIYSQMEYENKCDWTLGESKPNSNPIKPNFFKGQNERKLTYNKGLQKKRCFRSPKKQTQSQNRSPMPDVRGQISVFCLLFSVFCPRRLLIDPMLPLYKLSNVQYYSRHNFKVKLSKISIISILRQAKLTKYRWKIMPATAIFNPIKKLTIAWTGANLKGRRVI